VTWPRFALVVAGVGIGAGAVVFAILVAIDELVRRSVNL
jgi:hypothetical protein